MSIPPLLTIPTGNVKFDMCVFRHVYCKSLCVIVVTNCGKYLNIFIIISQTSAGNLSEICQTAKNNLCA